MTDSGAAAGSAAGGACPHCGTEVAPGREVQAGERPPIERATCRRCALQLVRRPGQPWHGIRG